MRKSITSIIIAASVAFAYLPLWALAYQAGPVAITVAPLHITEKSAQLNGQVNANEVPDTFQWFEWGVVGRPETVYETPHRSINTGNALRATNTTLNGLAPDRQYFYRQIVESSRGKDIGMTVYFTTKPLATPVTPILVVETRAPSNILETSITMKGYVSPHGNTNAQFWFEWGKALELEHKTSPRRMAGNSAMVETKLSNLEPGTSYFYRIVGENDLGIVYGITRMVVTHGVPLEAVVSEAPRDQSLPVAGSGDGEERTVTTSGEKKNTPTASNPAAGLFDAFLGKKKATTTAVATTAPASDTTANTPLGKFWGTLAGNKDVEVLIEKVGPDKVPAHTPIEYRITYNYRREEPASAAQLKIVLPENVIYIGDNTVNELLLEESPGPERTYVLPTGRLENGATRTVSILGMTTGAANGSFPDARARLEYANVKGEVTVVAAADGSTEATGTSGSGSFSILPHSFISWILYLVLVVGTIIGVRKAKEYYVRKKEEIAKEEELTRAAHAANMHENGATA
jgi:hypothetical protein